MAVELDPLFLKAITLLNSKHPDSGRQLKVLVQEYREKITGEPKREKIERRDSVAERVSPKIVEKSQHASDRSMSPVFSLSVTSSSVTQVDSASTTTAVEVVEEMSSSSYGDVLKEEQLDASMVKSIEELANSSFDSAIMEELNSSGLLEPSAKKKKLDTVIKEDSISSLSEEEEDSDDLLDETLEDFDGPKCCVCQSPSTDSPDNSLVECHECHNQYHQKCHKPPVTSKDVHDPRFVLYCSQCSRRMKKEMAAQKSSLSTSSTSMQEPTVAKPVTNPFQVKTSIQPFRRPTNSGNASEQTKAASSPFMPTALLQGNNGSNNGQSQNSQRGGPSLPQDVRMKSMKRLEQVKKRAKMQQQMRKR